MSRIYDGSSKWLLEHHGKSLAILGGLREVTSVKSIQSEVVNPVKPVRFSISPPCAHRERRPSD